jgi:hypothetical protein
METKGSKRFLMWICTVVHHEDGDWITKPERVCIEGSSQGLAATGLPPEDVAWIRTMSKKHLYHIKVTLRMYETDLIKKK